MKTIVSVIGGAAANAAERELAYQVGREIAYRGAVLLCGGRGGVMAAAACGAQEQGGLTIGVLPSLDPESANPHIDIVLPTGMGEARNVIVANAGVGVIAIGGAFGTLSEVAFALRHQKPVVLLNGWDPEFFAQLGRAPQIATTAEEAVAIILE